MVKILVGQKVHLTHRIHTYLENIGMAKNSYGFLIFSEYTCILHVSFIACCRYLLRLHGHMSSTEMLLHLEPSEVTKPILHLEVSSFPPSFPTFYNCAVVFTFIKELYVCVCETAPACRLIEVKALCQVPFSSQHSFPPLFFSLKQNKTKPDLRKLDAVGTDWLQQFLPVLPNTERGVEARDPEDSGRVGCGKMPREGKGEWAMATGDVQ